MTTKISRRAFIRRSFIAAGTSAIGLGVYSVEAEKRWIDFVELELSLPRLSAAFDGYRIVQISDLHMDGIGMTPRHLANIVTRINELQPDLIVVTGDYITHAINIQHHAPQAAQGLSKLRAVDGVLNIMGNHDHWNDITIIQNAMNDFGLSALQNDLHTIQRDNAKLHIAGFDSVYVGKDDLNAIMKKLPDDDQAAISLVHEPDFADKTAATGRFDLQLSGHTHGGQIRIPGQGAIFLPREGVKYPIGLYQVGEMIQYTNRGLGTSAIPVRFACRAEVTIITLRPPHESDFDSD